MFSQFNLLEKQHLTRLNDYTVALFTNTLAFSSVPTQPVTCGREEGQNATDNCNLYQLIPICHT